VVEVVTSYGDIISSDQEGSLFHSNRFAPLIFHSNFRNEDFAVLITLLIFNLLLPGAKFHIFFIAITVLKGNAG
jgi:hypothetical protein